MFQAIFNVKFSEKDNFKNGGDPNKSYSKDIEDIVITGDSVTQLMNNVAKHFNVSRESFVLDANDQVGQLEVQTYTKTLTGNKCSYDKLKQGFHKGEYDLWNHCFSAQVTTTPEIVNLTEALKA